MKRELKHGQSGRPRAVRSMEVVLVAAVACVVIGSGRARGDVPRPPPPGAAGGQPITDVPAPLTAPSSRNVKQAQPDLWVPLGLEPITARACVNYTWEEDVDPIQVRVDSEPQGAAVVSSDGQRLGATPLDIPLPRRRILRAVFARQGACAVSEAPAAALRDGVALGYTTDDTGGRWDPSVPIRIASDAVSGAVTPFESNRTARYSFTRTVRGWISPDQRTAREVVMTFECTWEPAAIVSADEGSSAGTGCDASLDVRSRPSVRVREPAMSETAAQVSVELVLAGYQPQTVTVTAGTPATFVRLVSEPRVEVSRPPEQVQGASGPRFLFCGAAGEGVDPTIRQIVAAAVQAEIGQRALIRVLQTWQTAIGPLDATAATTTCADTARVQGADHAIVVSVAVLGTSYVIEVREPVLTAAGGFIVEVRQGTAEQLVELARAAASALIDRSGAVPASAQGAPAPVPRQVPPVAPVPVAPGVPGPVAPSSPGQPQYGTVPPPGSPWPAAPPTPPIAPPGTTWPAQSPPPVVAPQEPESSPGILQLNAGFGAMFSGIGGGIELGYAGKYLGVGGFFNIGYFLSLGGGSGGFGYGGGGRLLVGYNPHFGYIAFAYSLAKVISATSSSGDHLEDKKWGPSLLFGYQYTGDRFRAFLDLGVSWVGDPYFEGDTISGAIFTLDIGVGVDLLV